MSISIIYKRDNTIFWGLNNDFLKITNNHEHRFPRKYNPDTRTKKVPRKLMRVKISSPWVVIYIINWWRQMQFLKQYHRSYHRSKLSKAIQSLELIFIVIERINKIVLLSRYVHIPLFSPALFLNLRFSFRHYQWHEFM